ncbi:helix-turn-helix domain-containing protein [Candidatus Peregrinibacteria bacterium]|nr:helix-turn-helix domain-containing protein [Candidatus Peregrinibacteria bacterium]
MEETILTVEQVAQILQVHPFTVLKFIKKDKLKAAKLGRVYRIRRSDVDKFLDELTNGGKSESPVEPKPARKKKVASTKETSADSALTAESGEDALPQAPRMEEHATTTEPGDRDNDHYEINFTI